MDRKFEHISSYILERAILMEIYIIWSHLLILNFKASNIFEICSGIRHFWHPAFDWERESWSTNFKQSQIKPIRNKIINSIFNFFLKFVNTFFFIDTRKNVPKISIAFQPHIPLLTSPSNCLFPNKKEIFNNHQQQSFSQKKLKIEFIKNARHDFQLHMLTWHIVRTHYTYLILPFCHFSVTDCFRLPWFLLGDVHELRHIPRLLTI